MSKIENLKDFLEKYVVLGRSYVNADKTEKIAQNVLP
jgi:hypothetical protein